MYLQRWLKDCTQHKRVELLSASMLSMQTLTRRSLQPDLASVPGDATLSKVTDALPTDNDVTFLLLHALIHNSLECWLLHDDIHCLDKVWTITLAGSVFITYAPLLVLKLCSCTFLHLQQTVLQQPQKVRQALAQQLQMPNCAHPLT